jgi:hypothetical protein
MQSASDTPSSHSSQGRAQSPTAPLGARRDAAWPGAGRTGAPPVVALRESRLRRIDPPGIPSADATLLSKAPSCHRRNVSSLRLGDPDPTALSVRRNRRILYPTAWRLAHTLLEAMVECGFVPLLTAMAFAYDAATGGKRRGGKRGRGAEGRAEVSAAAELDDDVPSPHDPSDPLPDLKVDTLRGRVRFGWLQTRCWSRTPSQASAAAVQTWPATRRFGSAHPNRTRLLRFAGSTLGFPSPRPRSGTPIAKSPSTSIWRDPSPRHSIASTTASICPACRRSPTCQRPYPAQP